MLFFDSSTIATMVDLKPFSKINNVINILAS